MKKTKFSEQQIAFALKTIEDGAPIVEVSRRLGVSEQTLYRWRKQFGGLRPSEARP